MATSYKNQGAGYISSNDLDQGAWQYSGEASISGTVGITANGTLTITGWGSEQNGSVGISGNGTLVCVGTAVNKYGTVSISGNGDLVATGASTRSGDVGISGGGSLVFPERAWGSVAITANGTLTLTGGGISRVGVVAISGEGSISLVGWINQPVEKVWMEAKIVQGLVGTSILRRDGAKWQT